jgi:Tfp pilus assembly protein PilF
MTLGKLASNNLVQRAVAMRDAQQMEAAYDLITRAIKQFPGDPRALFGHAQISYETWRPAADLFAAARAAAPANPDLIRNHALALAAEGEQAAAMKLLVDVLAANPSWVDGHHTLSTLRITGNSGEPFDQSYEQACRAGQGTVSLYMAWFQHHAVARDWAVARAILDQGKARCGPSRSFDLAAVFLKSESGDRGADFEPFVALRDPGLDLCQVRHCLREGRPDAAEAVAIRHMEGPAARIFWPYLSLCWRLQGDPRADWLDGAAQSYIQCFDLTFSTADLGELAAVLRGLHKHKSPYPEQSVRGGTQTDRQLFFNPDPAILNARTKIGIAIAEAIQALPEKDASHPLLGARRDAAVLMEGSWSVRLAGAGFHSSHTHVKGWLSSAFYVALPELAEAGPGPSGWLALGTPPLELGLALAPSQLIEPKPARLALFPSTMWHSTLPFAKGERLTIAFDVRQPPT